MISALSAEEAEGGLHVRLVLEIDPARAEAMEKTAAQARGILESMEGIAKADVLLSAHKAAPKTPPAGKKEAGERKLPAGVRRAIAVASGKGGVGKSTMAVNLALALAQKGVKVGLLDADIYGPSVPKLMGVEDEEIVNEGGRLRPVRAHGIALASIGFLVDPDSPMIWRGPMVHSAIKQLFFDVAWGDLDLLILDMPPGTGDAPLSVAQMVPLAGAVIVSTPQDVALLDVRKGVGMFGRLGVPVLGMIENMSYFECPHCHARTDIFGHGGAEKDAERLGVAFLGRVPLTLALREASDAGRPDIAQQNGPYGEIAEKIMVNLE